MSLQHICYLLKYRHTHTRTHTSIFFSLLISFCMVMTVSQQQMDFRTFTFCCYTKKSASGSLKFVLVIINTTVQYLYLFIMEPCGGSDWHRSPRIVTHFIYVHLSSQTLNWLTNTWPLFGSITHHRAPTVLTFSLSMFL